MPDEHTKYYANNTRFEPSLWDLKILFGELENGPEDKVRIGWRTAITMPWAQAKILAYYLRLNLAFHERQMGTINLPEPIHPTPPTPPDKGLESDPNAMEMYAKLQQIYTEMFG